MTFTLDPHTADDLRSDADPNGVTTSRPRWPIFGAVAGIAALAGAFVGMPADLTEEDWSSGAAVIEKLDRGGFHIAFILGLISIAALLVATSGWKRWAERNAPDDLAARTIPTALGATAAINIIGYSLMGSMALYMPGGTDEGWLSQDAMFINFTLLDFGVLLGWWGGMVAAGCVASLAFRKDRLLPRWMGVASVLLMLPALLMAGIMALPGMPGFLMPIWLTVVSVGLVFSRTAARR